MKKWKRRRKNQYTNRDMSAQRMTDSKDMSRFEDFRDVKKSMSHDIDQSETGADQLVILQPVT